jgi:hypothetical protein
MSFTRNEGVTRGIASQQRSEIVPGHYYYHNVGGTRYWHYYDSRFHWYGFYYGPRFFWLPFYAGFWWWYDPGLTRWLFWEGGYWWWYPPGGGVYIYVNDQYVPYEQYQQQVQAEPASGASDAPTEPAPKPPTAPPTAPSVDAAAKPPAKEGSTWVSPDKRRMVQIVGPQGEGLLYDESGPSPTLMKALTGNVESVRFSGGTSGRPLQILLDLKDGGFALFDGDGNPIKGPGP